MTDLPAPSGDDPSSDAGLVDALRAGDEAAFTSLVRTLHPTLRRLARGLVRSDALIDEVIQDTWVAVLNGLDRFEGRSSLRTWICRILLNRARTTGSRDARSQPMSSLGDEEDDAVDADRFGPGGRWTRPPAPWDDEDPARIAARNELIVLLEHAVDDLPDKQRVVVLLRDVQGWTPEEVCNALDLSETNQRVLLHRGRAQLRAVLETNLAVKPTTPRSTP